MTDHPQPIHPTPRCRDCAVEMELGFTPDLGHGWVADVRWVSGEPKPSWLSGEVSRSQYSKGLRTVTYRCPTCFRLESFAPPKPN
jgi:hypothetical protein